MPQVSEEEEDHYLGQFIPLHYHHNMLLDTNRMGNFKAAIDHVVCPGAKVLELGGGTGVLSFFAATAGASKVWCVEFNPELVVESRRLLGLNPAGSKVEVVHADAFHYLPPEPVDLVICEMVHVAMLREKQVEVISAFKKRYRERFGLPLPIFMPEVIVMAVQPLQEIYEFYGYIAPIVEFQRNTVIQERTLELAPPQVYSTLDFNEETSGEIRWEGTFTLAQDGMVNALRFITKNILAFAMEKGTTIDWLCDYMVLPVAEPLAAKAGDTILVRFHYKTGASLRSLEKALSVTMHTRGAS
jgi:predicted RNA methylase